MWPKILWAQVLQTGLIQQSKNSSAESVRSSFVEILQYIYISLELTGQKTLHYLTEKGSPYLFSKVGIFRIISQKKDQSS